METIGQILKNAREKKGLTIEELEATTHIVARFIKALENEEFDVLPGVTGWAQVNGRKEVPWPERIELNVWYAQHMSLTVDVKIFFMTIFKVVTNANNENVGETKV